MFGRGRQEALLPVVGRFLALTDRRPCEDFAGSFLTRIRKSSSTGPEEGCRAVAWSCERGER
jgi:hypothetical protein